jgi:hypothetical protein
MRLILVLLFAHFVQTPPAIAHHSPDFVVMLRTPPRGVTAQAWREAFAARGIRGGWALKDTLDTRSSTAPPWTLRVIRVEPREHLVSAIPDTNARGAALRAIAVDAAVAWAEPDFERQPAVHAVDDSLPPEPLLRDSRQWGLHNFGPGSAYGGIAHADIHAAEAWRIAAGFPAAPLASPALLAVADTGIDPAHPEFRAADGASRIVHMRATAELGATIHDSLGHGTMVAGVMAAATGEGVHFDSLGMAGVCGTCRIAPIRITRGSRRTASSFDIAQAILYATDIGARAMNLSFAGGGRSRLERLALTHAIARGCIVVAASGNRGFVEPQAPQYPAAYAADGLCLAVGASDSFDRRPLFSSYGPALDLVAPGLDIWSAWMTYPAFTGQTYPGYVAGSGTSFAAPFVTGAVGLLATARPALAAGDMRALLKDSADDLGVAGYDLETGAGRLNAARALDLVAPAIGILHEEAPATAFRDAGTGVLAIAEEGPGAFSARVSGADATRIECIATIAVPDSFVGDVRVWPRVAGTSTLRGTFTLPYHSAWSEAVLEGRTITLRGYVYRLESEDGEPPLWVPLPPDQMRFAFTVTGTVDRAPPAGVRPAAAMLRAHPNPSRGPVRIELPEPGTVTVLDLQGRRLWSAAGASAVDWPGTGRDGRPAAPGLYLMRFEGRGAARMGKLVRMR